jgi:hypothetical protein
MDLLFHEVPVVALLHQGRGGRHGVDLALHGVAGDVEDPRALVVDRDVVALLEVGDLVGERPDGQGVGADEHLPFAVAHQERAALAGAHDQLVLAVDQHADGVGAGKLIERGLQRFDRRLARRQLEIDQGGDDLGVRLALEGPALSLQHVSQLGEVLDDPVVRQGDAPGRLRVGVHGGGAAVGGPASVADADGGVQRVGGQHLLQRLDLARRTTSLHVAVNDAGHAGRVIAAVFQTLQAVDQTFLYGG